ncbi:aspartate:alanine exchanger family transporter [Corynebacterium sp. 11A]|uniref:aspartate:alanine exchanger family transporter n=1 Tax=Corynebacterium sp. 11A TaxID=2080510 RepID=UPI00124D1B29|nr:aspartate:alanine exchanger family transporter [Corynebacterium sp. 11A]
MSIFAENHLLALTVIMAVGLIIGRINIGGFRLGVAAVLFVGLGFATVEPGVKLPEVVYLLGLALFVYTIGLEAGPTFFASLRTRGLKHNAFILAVLSLVTAISWGLITLTGLGESTGAGMFTGAVTNTPALAAVVDSLAEISKPEHLDLPVVAYSLAYPLGVLGVIMVIAILAKVLKIDHEQEAIDAGVAPHELVSQRVLVIANDVPAVDNIPLLWQLRVIISRVQHGHREGLAEYGDRVRPGDILTIVGEPSEVERAVERLGKPLEGGPSHDEELDFRRIFVSSKDVVGVPLSKLEPKLQGMLVTRVRRGDADMVATPDMMLQLGDRVRVVADPQTLRRANRIFGDSYARVSNADMLPLLAGLALGLLVGLIPFPLPGGSELKLGSAGGPLLVALVLGAIGRTGPVVWQISYSANNVLRTTGITLFLAGIGTTAGAGFKTALSDPASLTIIGVGFIITVLVSTITILAGYFWMKIPFGQVAGILAGVQTHPAVLSYVSDQTKNELPAIGYTTVYPVSMVAKIILAQVLVFMLL